MPLNEPEDTAEWSLAAIELHDAWRWLLRSHGVARRTIGLDTEQQPKLWEALSPFTECCPWLQDAEQYEWIAERVTLLSPRNYEAWAMRGDAVRGIGAAPVARGFYVRAVSQVRDGRGVSHACGKLQREGGRMRPRVPRPHRGHQ